MVYKYAVKRADQRTRNKQEKSNHLKITLYTFSFIL